MVFNHGIHRIHGTLVSLVLLFGVAVSAVATEPGITVEARQRYPWNGFVDLKFTITGTSGTKYDTSFVAKDMVGGTNIAMKTIRKSDGTTAAEKEKLLPGTYNWIWDAAADLPDDFKCDRMTVTGAADISAFPYTVKFNANGGTGSMANQSFTYGTATALTANAFTRAGYVFQGWATSASGAKIYNDKQKVQDLTTDSDAVVNLYAVWKKDCNKVQLWANGPYWATMNIGAEEPWEAGYYFWWGDTIGYRWKDNRWVASDGSSSEFSFDKNILTYGKNQLALLEDGWTMVDNRLLPVHDAAQVHWGEGWRMPTYQELSDLNSKCSWTRTSKNGVNGYVITGKGDYGSDSIFLPVIGWGKGEALNDVAWAGSYWSSDSSSSDTDSFALYFDWEFNYHSRSSFDRSYGRGIRPVQDAK